MTSNINVSGGSTSGRIDVKTNTSVNKASATSDNKARVVDTVNNAAWVYSELAKKWAISENIVDNTDYSSKYYAGKSKECLDSIETIVEETIAEAVEEVEEKAESAAQSANDAQDSAETARRYSQEASTGLVWIEVKESDWVLQENGKYKYTINNLLAVSAVYQGEWTSKSLIDVNVEITNEKTYIYNSIPFDGYVLTSSAIIEPEEEIEASVLEVESSGVIEATREGRTVTLKSVNFVFEQGIASDTWIIVHNLGKKPSVILTDSAGTEFKAHVEYNTLDQLTVYINGATTGKAYLN